MHFLWVVDLTRGFKSLLNGFRVCIGVFQVQQRDPDVQLLRFCLTQGADCPQGALAELTCRRYLA